jgi:drug/metabolite transporter (DMT)-like permease
VSTGHALLVLSALLHASWNALVRRAQDKETAPLTMVAVCWLVSSAWWVLVARDASPSLASIGWAVAAGVAEGGYVLSLGRALRDAPLGLAYGVSRGAAMVIVWPVSIAFLDERPSARALGGAVALGCGLVAVSATSSGRSNTRLRWSWITATFIAAYHLAYGRALAEGIRAPTAVMISVGIGVLVAHISLPHGDRLRPLRGLLRQPLLLGVGGVLSAASFLVFLEGLARTGAGAALSLRNTSIVFTIVVSALMGERASARQWVGVVVVAAGAVLIGSS